MQANTDKASGQRNRAALFDLDGTLLNTLDDIADAMNTTLAFFGVAPWEKDAYRYMVGNGARVLAERAARDRQDLADQILAAYQRRYAAHLMDRTCPYDGMADTLRKLNRLGITMFVLSNKPDADTRRIIARSFPDIPFAHVQGQLPDVPRKPDPAAALRIAEQAGFSPENVFCIGDSSVDMECAVRAGMKAVGALWGYRTRTELEGSGAEYLIRYPEELVKILEKQGP